LHTRESVVLEAGVKRFCAKSICRYDDRNSVISRGTLDSMGAKSFFFPNIFRVPPSSAGCLSLLNTFLARAVKGLNKINSGITSVTVSLGGFLAGFRGTVVLM